MHVFHIDKFEVDIYHFIYKHSLCMAYENAQNNDSTACKNRKYKKIYSCGIVLWQVIKG